MPRRPALSDAGVTRPSRALVAPPEVPATQHAARTPARRGKRMVAAYVDEAAWFQLRQAALAERSTVQGIMVAALDQWFLAHGLPAITADPTN